MLSRLLGQAHGLGCLPLRESAGNRQNQSAGASSPQFAQILVQLQVTETQRLIDRPPKTFSIFAKISVLFCPKNGKRGADLVKSEDGDSKEVQHYEHQSPSGDLHSCRCCHRYAGRHDYDNVDCDGASRYGAFPACCNPGLRADCANRYPSSRGSRRGT